MKVEMMTGLAVSVRNDAGDSAAMASKADRLEEMIGMGFRLTKASTPAASRTRRRLSPLARKPHARRFRPGIPYPVRFQAPDVLDNVPETTPEAGKCTPGRPFWPSRDPIGEIGFGASIDFTRGLYDADYNFYSMLKNDSVNNIDYLGMFGYQDWIGLIPLVGIIVHGYVVGQGIEGSSPTSYADAGVVYCSGNVNQDEIAIQACVDRIGVQRKIYAAKFQASALPSLGVDAIATAITGLMKSHWVFLPLVDGIIKAGITIEGISQINSAARVAAAWYCSCCPKNKGTPPAPGSKEADDLVSEWRLSR